MTWQLCSLDQIPDTGPITNQKRWFAADDEEGDRVFLRKNDWIWPCYLKREKGLTVLRGLSQETRSQAGPLALHESGATVPLPELLFQELPLQPDLIDLRRVRATHQERLFPDKADRSVTQDGAAFYLAGTDRFETYFSSLKKNFRKNLRSAGNRIRKQFGPSSTELRIFKITPDSFDRAVDICREVSLESWQGKKGVSALSEEKRLAWLGRLLAKGLEMTLYIFEIKHNPAAVRWVLNHNGQILMYFVEYKKPLASFRPGHLLMLNILESFFQKGFDNIDFGYGESNHKSEWNAIRVPLCRIMVPVTAKGKLALEYQNLRWAAGRLVRSFGKP